LYPTASCRAQGTFIEQQVVGLRNAGATVEVLHLDRQAKGVLVYRYVGSQLLALVESFSPDLVHVMYGGVLADRATCARLAVPTVVSFCGSDLLGDKPNGWSRRIMGQFGVFASQRAALRADGIIVKSDALRDALNPAVDRNKVWTISNGIDPTRFCPLDKTRCQQLLDWGPSRLHVLFANGKDNRIKRIQLAEAAIQFLQSAGVPVDFHVMTGVPHDQVPIYLNAADALLLTSVQEGSPNIVKEALACDRPVVSVDVGDFRQRLEPIDGCYVAEPTPEALAGALRKVFLGNGRVNGHTRMRSLSLTAVSRDLMHVYGEVLARFQRNVVSRESAAHVV